MVFRWTVWGDTGKFGELLRHSVGTFRRWFGKDVRYIVCSDDPTSVEQLFHGEVEVMATRSGPFDIATGIAWQKWCPAVRLAPGESEIYLDCDVFAVGDPHELRNFCSGNGDHFLAFEQPHPLPSLYGLFHARIPAAMTAPNAGLVGQQPQADLTADLVREYEWWQGQVRNDPAAAAVWHYEQGAVASALGSHFAAGRVEFLPAHRYALVSPRSNAHLDELDGMAVIHATFPSHPAFHLFQKVILANSEFA
jgi:hypothetical protein